ncbi:transcription termination factor NusA [candidate division WOR-1 bacterium RIFOXYA12_FULL_52_29]|uniref:Transcription termination/antitermination protein NusA n=1 Tax=candidate division WOR-1 bacterium RIFOXYC12_FULL_54_18 TaxID=1802584 RepID=A0A1F4T4W0_UNCSA|nr:MAG: transcription termination factor NusA [candidate division WOR-1 bacterium RIFOXYA2_FULL_51_19]OGC17179.1 MAG: transcription termination factor NusA [candidate division WOR-1 bacterium RIFOXYA12_FULL_52_29]OGC26039.1 MAG: transcription termination factor NusA [candidate division WOR-1 bacterium RIFOXYB2_FULL_45_9]OGC27596.1 MAG: transcription termination factor NusA [candidate division WOR-1 bacterium RIFOXYC12_FULL_54_18]OGC29190.1 MAG: transcription termination factor NusA [candidate d
MKIENFNAMLEEIQRERGLSKEVLLDTIRASLLSAAKKRFAEGDNIDVQISDTGEVKLLKIVEGAEPEDVTPHDFSRFAAQTAKQVIIQRLREAEKEETFDEYTKKQGEIINGIVQRKEFGGYLVNLGRLETILPITEQIPGEVFRERDRVKFYVVETKKSSKGPLVIISRSHPNLIRRLFEMEIPEIKEGILEIKAIAREPGKRTKVAIYSNDPNVGAVGTCVGKMGQRIQNIVRELGPERIDIVEWSEDQKKFIANSLSPAKVNLVELNDAEKSARVHVADKEVSLAIGKEGQNVRLAVKLTGWKIDLISEGREEKPSEVKSQTYKVHELAKELEMTSNDLVLKLREMGYSVKAANSTVPAEAVITIKSEKKGS